MKEFLGDRQITVAKEITKIHENIIKGNLDNILDKIKLIGDDKGGFYLFDNDIKLLITAANKA